MVCKNRCVFAERIHRFRRNSDRNNSKKVRQNGITSVVFDAVKGCHTSILRLFRNYPNILVPKSVLHCNIAPVVMLNKDEIVHWNTAQFKRSKHSLAAPKLSRKVSAFNNQNAVVMLDKNEIANWIAKQVKRLPYWSVPQKLIGVAKRSYNSGKRLNNGICYLRERNNNIVVFMRDRVRGQLRASNKKQKCRTQLASNDMSHLKTVPDKKKRIYHNKNGIAPFQRREIPLTLPTDTNELKLLLTSSLRLLPTSECNYVNIANSSNSIQTKWGIKHTSKSKTVACESVFSKSEKNMPCITSKSAMVLGNTHVSSKTKSGQTLDTLTNVTTAMKYAEQLEETANDCIVLPVVITNGSPTAILPEVGTLKESYYSSNNIKDFQKDGSISKITENSVPIKTEGACPNTLHDFLSNQLGDCISDNQIIHNSQITSSTVSENFVLICTCQSNTNNLNPDLLSSTGVVPNSTAVNNKISGNSNAIGSKQACSIEIKGIGVNCISPPVKKHFSEQVILFEELTSKDLSDFQHPCFAELPVSQNLDERISTFNLQPNSASKLSSRGVSCFKHSFNIAYRKLIQPHAMPPSVSTNATYMYTPAIPVLQHSNHQLPPVRNVSGLLLNPRIEYNLCNSMNVIYECKSGESLSNVAPAIEYKFCKTESAIQTIPDLGKLVQTSIPIVHDLDIPQSPYASESTLHKHVNPLDSLNNLNSSSEQRDVVSISSMFDSVFQDSFPPNLPAYSVQQRDYVYESIGTNPQHLSIKSIEKLR